MMATTMGTLMAKTSSTAARPTVYYSAAYTAARADGSQTATVTLTVSAWLNEGSSSNLGTGIRLTVFARINGGVWQTAVLKNLTDYWSGAARHSVSVTLTVNTLEETGTLEFYISRTGSRYSGSAGILGSSANPLRYFLGLPGYTPVRSSSSTVVSTDTVHYVYVKIGGTWRQAIPYVRMAGTWKKAVPYARVNGMWKST